VVVSLLPLAMLSRLHTVSQGKFILLTRTKMLTKSLVPSLINIFILQLTVLRENKFFFGLFLFRNLSVTQPLIRQNVWNQPFKQVHFASFCGFLNDFKIQNLASLSICYSYRTNNFNHLLNVSAIYHNMLCIKHSLKYILLFTPSISSFYFSN
jgi:hypothetical protein